jgi:hypothetical protein
VQRAESALDPDAEIEPLDLFEAIRAEGQSVSAAVLRGVSRNADTASR